MKRPSPPEKQKPPLPTWLAQPGDTRRALELVLWLGLVILLFLIGLCVLSMIFHGIHMLWVNIREAWLRQSVACATFRTTFAGQCTQAFDTEFYQCHAAAEICSEWATWAAIALTAREYPQVLSEWVARKIGTDRGGQLSYVLLKSLDSITTNLSVIVICMVLVVCILVYGWIRVMTRRPISSKWRPSSTHTDQAEGAISTAIDILRAENYVRPRKMFDVPLDNDDRSLHS